MGDFNIFLVFTSFLLAVFCGNSAVSLVALVKGPLYRIPRPEGQPDEAYIQKDFGTFPSFEKLWLRLLRRRHPARAFCFAYAAFFYFATVPKHLNEIKYRKM